MAHSMEKPPRVNAGNRLAGTITLAFWQLRLTWRLLLVTGAGVVAAVILVCSVPLYAQVAMSAGLRDALTTSNNASITIHSVAHMISQAATQKVGGEIQQELQENLGRFLQGSQFSAQSSGLQLSQSANELQLIGWSMSDAGAHVKLLEGELPADGAASLDIAITSTAAQQLHLKVGSLATVTMPFVNATGDAVLYPLKLRVTGIFSPTSPGENFWHGTSFATQMLNNQGFLYPSLVSNTSYISVLETITKTVSQGDIQNGANLEYPTDFYWYYNFATSSLNIDQLDDIASGLNGVLVAVSNQPVDEPFIDQTTSSGPASIVNDYDSRISVTRIPLLSLSYLIAGLMLFFVSLMTDLLVDRQSEVIAILHSRGASRQQVFNSLITQSIGVGLVALVAGPFLALLVTRFLVAFSLSSSDQGAINVILASPLSTVMTLALSALITVIVSVLAMVFAISRASRMDVLSVRREASRSSRGPAWLRMGLDVLAGVIALTGYGFSVYITSPGVLDARTRVLILPPMALIGAIFLLLGCMLLFLRIFPFMLNGLANLAIRGRGVTSMLAVAQMARAPRQSLRMTLLLALAVAFGIFSLVFGVSQQQRIPSVAAYEVGADFSGTYASGVNLSKKSPAQQEAAFERIAGVHSASIGYMSSTRGSESGINASIELRAVDTRTFAETAIWSTENSSYPLTYWMEQLIASDKTADQDVVPAIVDTAAWQSLGLTVGDVFTLSDLNGNVSYLAIGEVNYIPTVIDSTEVSGTNDYVAQGGVLVDFSRYQSVLQISTPVAPSTVWLNTSSDAHSLASVRAALGSGALRLTSVNDLFALENSMDHDPLYLALLGVLAIGTVSALLLGLLGNLTVSWLSARGRLMNFAVMRALGIQPGQIVGILTYEQVIVYATAIGLGVAFGLLLSFLILPTFVLTSSVSGAGGTGLFYVAQSVPPIQMIVPGILIALAVGILAAVCVIVLGMMVRIVSRPALSSMLRLNGD